MLTSILTVAFLLAAGVAAESDPSFPEGFNPGAVDQDDRSTCRLDPVHQTAARPDY